MKSQSVAQNNLQSTRPDGMRVLQGYPRNPGLVILIPILIMFMAGPACALSPLLSVENQTAPPGSQMTIPIRFTGSPDLAAVDFILIYDPEILKFERIDPAGLSTNGIMEANETDAGTLVVGIADPAGIRGGTTIANVKFRVNGPEGTSTPIYIQADNAAGPDLSPVDLQVKSATFTVGNPGSGSSGGKLPLPAGLAVVAIGAAAGMWIRRKQRIME